MQAGLGSDPATSQSTPGRTRRSHDRSREFAREEAGATPSEATKALIYRRSRLGVSVEVLAIQVGLSRSRTQRVLDEMKARRLLDTKLVFVREPIFDDPAAVAEFLGPAPGPAAGQGSRRTWVPDGLPPYLASLYQIPLLSREQERYLFRKMNYLKYRAHQLRETLDPGHCDAVTLDAIERLQEEALSVKNQIIRANLRLVVSFARRFVGPSNNLFELVTEGNMSLIRAVEKFDAGRGFKFSTYASWAIMRNFSRLIPEERNRRDRFLVQGSFAIALTPMAPGPASRLICRIGNSSGRG
jgi:RNA polymerase primary sigma factor